MSKELNWKKIIDIKNIQEEIDKNWLNINEKEKNIIKTFRKQISDILVWKDKRKLIIIWPCSVDFEESIIEYAKKLKEISDDVKDKLLIVMRTYTAKPRTTVWWKWVLYNWELWKQWNLRDWILFVRKLYKKITEIWLPIADEMLYPSLTAINSEYLSYLAIWARSSENQEHREVASLFNIPVWIKNNTAWNIKRTVDSLESVQASHQVHLNWGFYQSDWNKLSHIILRGYNDWYKSFSNIKEWEIERYLEEINKRKLINNWIIIDANHDNSWKNISNQIENIKFITYLLNTRFPLIKWYMVESYLHSWNQKINSTNLIKWKSITDPCISIIDTENIIKYIYKKI